jgi:hypothetical protein
MGREKRGGIRVTRWARLLLLLRITRSDGELTDQGQDLAEELHRGRDEPDDRPEPGPVHPDGRVY